MNGKGIYSWKDGRKYEGDYKDDKKEGFGIYVWADGRRYEGGWKNGKQHGEGKYFLPNGDVKYGLWDSGKRIKWMESGSPTSEFAPQNSFFGNNKSVAPSAL
jgi:hypothetical protein